MIARIAALFAVLGALLVSSAALAQDAFHARYSGELLDPDMRPISGVFPITFVLAERADDERALWSELRYVAVDNGMYTIELGRERALPAALSGRELWLSVRIGDAEVGGQRWAPTPWVPPTDASERALIDHVSFVELAGHAINADRAGRARDCRTIGGTPARDLDRYTDIMERITALRAEVTDAERVIVGLDRRIVDRIGGEGGTPYETACPPGYIVTGAQGFDGNVVDGFQFVCSQLLND